MIKPEITPEQLEKTLKNDHNRVYIQMLERRVRYEALAVGDVVNSSYTSSHKDAKKRYVTYPDTENPVKFLVVWKGDAGITLVKRVCTNGKLGKEIICLEQEGRYNYEIDEQAIDCTLLDQEYHPEDSVLATKKIKDRMRQENKDSSVLFDSLLATEAWMNSNLAVGTQFWTLWRSDLLGGGTAYTVTKIERKCRLRPRESQYRDPDSKYVSEGMKFKTVITVSYTCPWSSGVKDLDTKELCGQRLMLVKPKAMKDEM